MFHRFIATFISLLFGNYVTTKFDSLAAMAPTRCLEVSWQWNLRSKPVMDCTVEMDGLLVIVDGRTAQFWFWRCRSWSTCHTARLRHDLRAAHRTCGLHACVQELRHGRVSSNLSIAWWHSERQDGRFIAALLVSLSIQTMEHGIRQNIKRQKFKRQKIKWQKNQKAEKATGRKSIGSWQKIERQ